jgi:hypothetical protein
VLVQFAGKVGAAVQMRSIVPEPQIRIDTGLRLNRTTPLHFIAYHIHLRDMSYSSNTRVKHCVDELATLLCGLGVGPHAASAALRMLRPAKGGVEHISAIRARIRQSILNNHSNGDAQLELNKFEKLCDDVQRTNPKLLNPFLQLLQPLSFMPEQHAVSGRLSEFSAKPAAESAFTGVNVEMGSNGREDDVQKRSPGFKIERGSNGQDVDVEASAAVWVSKDVETLLLVDVIYVLQVRSSPLTSLKYSYPYIHCAAMFVPGHLG